MNGVASVRSVAMRTDLVLSPFGADPAEFVAAARVADGGFDGLCTYDHFSGAIAGKPWSRDPWVLLGATAPATARVRLGVLVANVYNRHPAQLASAVSTLQALAPGRVMCGVGAGAAPGSRFAVEHELIGRDLDDASARRKRLAETIDELRAIWDGSSQIVGVVDAAPPPPIIVGASSTATVEVAAERADGVNILSGAPRFDELLAVARTRAVQGPFEISVFEMLDIGHPLGGDPSPLAERGVARRTLHVAAPYPIEAIGGIAANLATQ